VGGAILADANRVVRPDVVDRQVRERQGTLKGGYTLVKETTKLENIIIGVGSELSMAVEAAKELGPGTRVVSMPCVELYEAQLAEYKEEVLPAAMKSKTTAVEAGVSAIWYKYADKVLGVDSFGESAPAQFVFEAKGITVDNIVKTVKA
jgi:transketolase